MDKKILIIFIVLFLSVTAIAFFIGRKMGYGLGLKEGKEAAAKPDAGKAVSNPLEKMPSANPFENVINPFKDLYINPFK